MKPEKNIQLTKGEKFILIVYGIMAFCSLLMLFKPKCTHDDMQMQFEKAQSEMLLQNAQKQKADYERQIVRLEKSNFVLKKLLTRADAELDNADNRNDFLKRKIHAYSDSVPLDSLVNQANCDSLRTYSLQL
jgi:septal ring factor EnvC (AmiA/AmiB activator)